MEPLQSLLSLYQNTDQVLREFLPKQTVSQLYNVIYYDETDDMMYLGDHIILVSKQTGLVEAKGKCIKITDDTVTLKHPRCNLCYVKTDYYLFLRHRRKTNKDKRMMFQELLKQL